MKKLLIILAFTLGVKAANAQSETFKPFKVEVGFGITKPFGEGSISSVILMMEPKYAINDKLTVGIRLESTDRPLNEFDGRSIETQVTFSYLGTVDYYLNTNAFRPFAGIGAGIHRIPTSEILNGDQVKIGNQFGFAPRIGFELSHFRTAVEYNYIGKSEGYNYSYVGFKFGLLLGGGRK